MWTQNEEDYTTSAIVMWQKVDTAWDKYRCRSILYEANILWLVNELLIDKKKQKCLYMDQYRCANLWNIDYEQWVEKRKKNSIDYIHHLLTWTV